jgi:hypothetical protein
MIMLGAIGYATLSTQERPFDAIRLHVSPVLAWGWLLAAAAVSMVWCLTQYLVAHEVLSDKLLPSVFGAEGLVTRAGGGRGPVLSATAMSVAIFLLCATITWCYDWGIRICEWMLKLLVTLVVLGLISVVCVLAARGSIAWSQVAAGLVPDIGQFWRPAASYQPMLEPLDEAARVYWSDLIVARQRDVILGAVTAAVGIPLTLLFPYSLRKRGWTHEFRGLAAFDLVTGMLVPYCLATGCVVVAAAALFHTQVTPDFQIARDELIPPPDLVEDYQSLLTQRMLSQDAFLARQLRGTPKVARAELQKQELEQFLAGTKLAEKKIAAVLILRQPRHLTDAMAPAVGKRVAHTVFCLGVLAMALAAISLSMLIWGFVVCEIFGAPLRGWVHWTGALAAGAVGAVGPIIWNDKIQFYLVVPPLAYGLALLPFTYVAFLLLMNQPALLGQDLPRGRRRLVGNALMALAVGLTTVASLHVLYHKTQEAWGSGWYGLGGIGVLLLAVLIARFTRAPAVD